VKLTVLHTTRYTYDAPVDYALQQVRLTPPTTAQQLVLSWALDIEGGRVETSYANHHGAHVDLVSVDRGGDFIAITAKGEVETINTAGVLGQAIGPAPIWHYCAQTELTKPGPLTTELAAQLREAPNLLDGLHAMSDTILTKAPYTIGSTYAETSAEDALAGKSGVCQDHAQIFVSAARAAGIPARYVSGYLMMDDRIEQDASHAWAEAHVDGLGWVGFDVSNGISPDERYVRLASGLDYPQAAPITGLRLGNAKESMIVSLQIEQ
jgi:transglutaminase-like putative cysteine protease